MNPILYWLVGFFKDWIQWHHLKSLSFVVNPLTTIKIYIVVPQIFIKHLILCMPSTKFSKLPAMSLIQMIDLWFRLDREINKNAHICTASREIPMQCQSFGYPYKENIATHVQNKLWSINSAQKSFFDSKKAGTQTSFVVALPKNTWPIHFNILSCFLSDIFQ